VRIKGRGCDGRIEEIHRGILKASLDSCVFVLGQQSNNGCLEETEYPKIFAGLRGTQIALLK
jgi:hypothetical protein